MFPNTSKPIVAWSYDALTRPDIHEIAVAEAGGQEAFEKRPNYVHYCEPLSPLVSTLEAHRQADLCRPAPGAGDLYTLPHRRRHRAGHGRRHHHPGRRRIVDGPDPGPGHPARSALLYGRRLSVMDMSSMILAYGAPELSLMMAGITELAHFAGLPLWQTGGCTDSKTFDEQAVIEGSLSVFFSALTGGDLCHDVGYTESGLTGSIFQTAMMDEAIGYSRRITRGIEVNEDTLAVDVIHNVGPNGHYLREQHTRRYYKTEFWYPNLCDRRNYEEWEMMGKTTMKDRTVARVRDILATHQPSPIKPETEEAIQQVLAEAEERVKERIGERIMSRIYERIVNRHHGRRCRKRPPSWSERGLEQGLAPKDILDNGMVVGMNEVGVRFKAGDMFVPEVLMSADAMQAGLEVLRPQLVASGVQAHRQDRDGHRQGRPARHRQEPGGHDVRRRRL